MNFDDTAKFRGSLAIPTSPTQVSNGKRVPLKGKWKHLPSAWYPELPGKGEATGDSVKLCADCKETAVKKRFRFCEECKTKRRKKTFRKSTRRKRIS